MSRSFALYDAMFDLAHLLKVASYVCVLTGLLIEMYHLFQLGDLNAASLQKEVEVRTLESHHEEAKVRAVIEASLDSIITINEVGIIQTINGSTVRMFGYREDELLGHNINCLMPTPYRENHDQYLEDYLRTGEKRIIGQQRELLGRRKNGEAFPLDLSVAEVETIDGRLFMGTVRDINAIKHHDRTGGNIHVSTSDAGDFYEFVVTDDGPGIPHKHQKRIFQMFQTLRPRDEVEGSGMGLAVVKRLVESQGGCIDVDSQPGDGATFRFTWAKVTSPARQESIETEVTHA